ncbi:MAG: hypothetical protein SNH27_07510 [Rikenellaceae bacterium]
MNNQRLAQLAAYGMAKLTAIEKTGLGISYEFGGGNYVGVKHDGILNYHLADKVKPHLRSMKNLDKPIVVEGYNNNEPFVPQNIIENVLDSNIHIDYISYDSIQTYGDILWSEWCEVFDLLNLWQFDCRGWIEQGLAVELKEE